MKNDGFIGTKMNITKKEVKSYLQRLYPFCRSISGSGLRETLAIIKEYIPIYLKELKTGTKVFDWIIPEEWHIQGAHIKDPKGKKIIDFKKSNLHIVNYSIPINKKIHLKELKKHLYTLPQIPDAIPYITSYYNRDWGFSMTYSQYKNLNDGIYEVFIDSEIKKGKLSYGEYFIKGKSAKEILLSTYTCHPSLANDNLSGIVLSTYLARFVSEQKNYYSYRFLFIPETIGSLAWLSQNKKNIHNIKYGLIVTCVGDSGNSTYKKTRDGNSILDQAAEKMLIDSKEPYKIITFDPADGSDERQFSSPGFNLPVGSLMRTPYGQYREYHTSEDNLSFIKPKYLLNSLDKYLKILYILENNRYYLNCNPHGEPMLGKRGLYRSFGSNLHLRGLNKAFMWILNYSDGDHSLLDIATMSNIDFQVIKEAADILHRAVLIKHANKNEPA